MKHNIARKIHLWLSVPFGLLISVICLSGAILVFERGFEAGSRCYISDHETTAVPLDSILTTVQNQLSDNSHITAVTFYDSPDKACKVMLNHHSEGAMWVNQYTGQIIGPYERPEIFKIASSAHRRLFDKSKAKGGGTVTGKTVVGVITIALVIILITGIIIWVPTSRHEWKSRLSIPLHRGWPAFMHGLHCAGGMYVTIVLLACCLTGLTWSFKWYNTGFYTVLGSEVSKRSSHTKPAKNFEAWRKAYDEVATKNPGKEIRVYEGEIDVVRDGLGSQYDYDNYRFDSKSGEITTIIMHDRQPKAKQIKGWINTLHFGTWGGWPIKIVYFIFAFIGATLPITGYYIWIKRIRHKHRHQHHE